MRRRSLLAWAVAGFGAALTVAGIVLALAAQSVEREVELRTGGVVSWVPGVTSCLVFGAIGALIAARHPRNPIGWIFCAVGVSTGLSYLSLGYVALWLAQGTGPDSVGEAAAVYHNASWVPGVLLPTTFLLLLFPDGRVIGRRWRLIGWCAAVGMAGVFLAAVLAQGPLEDFPTVDNPYGVAGADALGLFLLPLLVGVVGSVVSLVLRFRRAAHEPRQQIKWVGFAGAIAGAIVIVFMSLYDVVGEDVANAAILLSVMGMPIGAAIAILRHRLYDIDVVIHRALVYGMLSASLAGTYLATVLLLQVLLAPLTEQSDPAIAGSTLAVAGLFGPARRRIQATVDRRFYRSRYDATRTLEAFGVRLRDEVDLETLAVELQAVVAGTMQPSHLTLWLRDPGR